MLLVCILSISTISATEDTSNNGVISANNNKKVNLETKYQYDDVSISDDNSQINLEENNYKCKVSESGTNKITTSNGDPLSFKDLNTTINDNTNSTIQLSNNYKYDKDKDSVFQGGIFINRNLTIYGNEVTLDGNNMARIFKVDDNVTVNFHNIKFINGKADYGGATYGGNAYNCTFTKNTAQHGGAIYNGKSYNCTFTQNKAEEDGGALFLSNATDCIFTENKAEEDGGAINNGNGYNCTFTNNTAKFGGAIAHGNAYNCKFTDNKATNGGVIYDGNAYHCAFTNNIAANNGGAIFVGEAYNSTFTNNKATNGGAMCDGKAINCTFTENNATGDGGAMYGGTAILCIFNGDTTKGTEIIPAIINVLNYTSTYKSSERLKFNLTINGKLYDGFNTTINIYKGDVLNTTVYALSNEGWIVDLEPGEYAAVLSLTDYPDEPSSNATITVRSTLTDLNTTINNNTNSTIYLPTNNYYKYDASDEELIFGININRNLTIYGNGATIDGEKIVRIFDVENNVTVKFYNITFKNGKAEYGGAIYGGNAYGCIFINNTAEFAGGAIYGGNAYNCTFTENEASLSGGAISNGNAYNSTFNKNKAFSWDGGAIDQGNAINCTFTENEADHGGAIDQGNAYNSIFIENKANQEGGAIYDGNAINCTFKGNNATNGGAIYDGNAINCTFNGNNATNGGAMYEGTAILCIFNGDTTKDTEIIPAIINVINYTSTYKSGEKLQFNLTVNGTLYDGFNTTIKIYKDGVLVKTVYALSGEGWLVDLTPDEYIAELSLPLYTEVTPINTTINVSKANTTVVIDPIIDAIVGKEITIKYITNSNGTVTIKVNGEIIPDGKFTPTKAGTYNLTIEISENDYYTAGYNETTFTVEKTNTTILISPIIDYVVGETIPITFTSNSNGTATIKVNGKIIPDGKFTPTKAGTYNLTIEISENDYYTAGSNKTTFTVGKLESQIIASPITTTYNVGKNLVITLKDQNGKGIKGAVLTVNLGGSKKITTDANGQIKINVATLTPKTYNVKIIYAESDNYKGSTATVKVTVKKATPKITTKSANYKLKIKTKKYTAIFKDNKNRGLKTQK
ncbi:hypothetical protein [uncultured Methanobrevibacter sp.]|uniref:hypothetical protein n=1 Tax=uncultured Methanobrevibacter sp. TaxID=253161 RepID=UPI0025E2ED29|nr:hypothetical protein [uncultured Methanobrevibacter sp.]